MKKVWFAFGLLTVFSCGQSTPNKIDIENKKDTVTPSEETTIAKQLISHSEWRLESKVSQKLGQSCTNEEYLSFEKDSLVHTICKNGELQTTKEAWMIKQTEDGQLKMMMAGAEYSVIVSGNTLMIIDGDGKKDQDSSGKKFIGETN